MVISLLIIVPLTFINVNLPQLCLITGTTMHTTIAKEKPTRTAITPKSARRSTRPSQSPHSDEVKSVLAEIILPVSRFNKVLETLHPLTRQDIQMDDDLNDPWDLTLPTDKINQITPLASPMGVNIQTLGFPTPVKDAVAPQANEPLQEQSIPPNKGVCINKTAISTENATIPTRTSQQSKTHPPANNQQQPPG